MSNETSCCPTCGLVLGPPDNAGESTGGPHVDCPQGHDWNADSYLWRRDGGHHYTGLTAVDPPRWKARADLAGL